ncbi:MAG: PCP reductase family protein [Candidatus Methylomirabilales bacterium]
MLASGRDAGPDAVSPSAAPSGCPFSAVANLAAQRPDAVGETGKRGNEETESSDRDAGSSDCRVSPGCTWSPEAERRLERIPEFIRPMVRRGIEQFAADRGYRRITEDVMQEARGGLGI